MSQDLPCKQEEIISMAFAPTNEKFLITLTNEPEQTVVIWLWDKARIYTYSPFSNNTSNVLGTQVSFSNTDEKSVLITGPSTYKFFRIQETQNLKQTASALTKKEAHISSNYTCHCWLPEGKFLIGTDQGEILLCEPNGELKMDLKEAPGDGFYI